MMRVVMRCRTFSLPSVQLSKSNKHLDLHFAQFLGNGYGYRVDVPKDEFERKGYQTPEISEKGDSWLLTLSKKF